jgi:hypothetical protein
MTVWQILRLEIRRDRGNVDRMRDGTSKLAHDRPAADGAPPSAQVLQFRPRERLGERAVAASIPESQPNEPESGLIDDLEQYEQDQVEENINYPHRMLMNAIAVAVVTLLIGVGVWLADTIADMERDQDCLLQGRQNCAPIEIAAPIQK